MLDNLEKLDDPSKVVSTFTGLVFRNAFIVLWIDITNKKKRKVLAKALKVQKDKGIAYFTTTEKLSKLSRSDVIYALVEDREIVFKAKIVMVSEFKIGLEIPKELYYQDLNVPPRYDISDKNFMASFGARGSIVGKKRIFRSPAKIINHSENGIAITVKKSELPKYLLGSSLSLKYSIHGKRNRTGTIVHITPSESDDYILGIKLNEITSSEWTGVFRI